MSALATAPAPGVPTRRGSLPAPRILPAVLTAVFALAAAGAVYGIAVWTSAGQLVDQYVLDAVRRSSATAYVPHPLTVDSVTDPRVWIGAALCAIVGSLIPAISRQARLGPALAKTATLLLFPVVIVGLARYLRDGVLVRPRLHDWITETSNSAPSGHAAASSACVVVLIAASPKWLRPFVAAIGATWASVVAFGLIADGWHRPSDIVISVLIVIGLGALLPDPYTDSAAPWGALGLRFTAFLTTAVATPVLVAMWYPEHQQIAAAAGIGVAIALALTSYSPCAYRPRN